MTYFSPVPTHTGLNPLPTNPCNLLDFHLLRLTDGQMHEGTSGDREILAVLLGGKGTFTVNSHSFEKVGGRPNVFSSSPATRNTPSPRTGVWNSVCAVPPAI